jgi:hypothetical protein
MSGNWKVSSPSVPIASEFMNREPGISLKITSAGILRRSFPIPTALTVMINSSNPKWNS